MKAMENVQNRLDVWSEKIAENLEKISPRERVMQVLKFIVSFPKPLRICVLPIP